MIFHLKCFQILCNYNHESIDPQTPMMEAMMMPAESLGVRLSWLVTQMTSKFSLLTVVAY